MCMCVIAPPFLLLYFIYWRQAKHVVPPAAVMENEPPGFFPVLRGDFGDPQILRICHFSNGFKFYGKLELLKQQCRSVVDLIVGSVIVFVFFSFF